jgi:hypothetical protein
MELMTSSFPANSRQSKKTCIQCRQRKVTPLTLPERNPPRAAACAEQEQLSLSSPPLSPLLLTSLLHVMKANPDARLPE